MTGATVARTAKRLLAISWDMPPLSGPRAVQVSRTLKHLVPLGWSSTVVCFGVRSNRYNQDAGLAARLAAPGVDLVPVPSPEEHMFFRALWRTLPPLKRLPDEKRVWVRAATAAVRRLTSRSGYDAVVSYAQPWSDHLVGLRAKQLTGRPWIAHFSDPWVDSPYHNGGGWTDAVARRMEANVIGAADALIFVNRQTADRVMAKYPDGWRSKVAIVPHGFDPEDCAAPAIAPATGPLRLVYTGRFYEGLRTADGLLSALGSLGAAKTGDFHLTLVGTPLASHRRLVDRLGLNAVVELTGRVDAAESRRRARAADVLLVIDAPARENLFLPSKVVDYLPLFKPLLALTPAQGATADLVAALGYRVVPPDDERAIGGALTALLVQKRSGALTAAPRHGEVAAPYDIRRTTEQFAEVLSRCA